MPYINVRITAGASQEQKDLIIKGITQVMVDVLHKNPENTHIVIDEIPPENWGINGVNTVVYREQKRQANKK
ncbi:MAG: 4-oxalocrotonate tautomerase family protein [Anaerolineae bacterium]|jgi:4-oxalocrotonate tautomerase|nr:4-oxalocrotonate tautomerase family protein [Anaerolineae bacterium]